MANVTTTVITNATLTSSAATAALSAWAPAHAVLTTRLEEYRRVYDPAARPAWVGAEKVELAAAEVVIRGGWGRPNFVLVEGDGPVPAEVAAWAAREWATLVRTEAELEAAVAAKASHWFANVVDEHECNGLGEVELPYRCDFRVVRVVPDHPSGVKFLASADPTALAAVAPTVTVEAEYGDVCVPGAALTMAHHGPRAGQQCPGTYTAAQVCAALVGHRGGIVVGLSHFDLDTLGGCMAVLDSQWGNTRHEGDLDAGAFWALAEWVDLRGAHRMEGARALLGDRYDLAARRVRAFWAWSNANRGPMVRGSDLVDLTDHVRAAALVVDHLLTDWAAAYEADYEAGYGEETAHLAAHVGELLAAGDAADAAQAELRRSSLVEASTSGRVLLRFAEQFVNHLYPEVDGGAVVGFNPKTGAVTVSFADGAESPYSAVEIVQGLWGPLAGGHRGIAGSPRGTAMTMEGARSAFHMVRNAMGEAYDLRDPAGCPDHHSHADAACAACFA